LIILRERVLIGVKKERSEEQKQHVYDPENLTLSYSYNEVEKHNYELENYVDQTVSATVDYTYAFKPSVVEPLKSNKYFKKSDYWKLLSDFNVSYLPASISYSSNITRQYNEQQFRQVDVEGIALETLYRRNYMYNYQYGFNYNLTKALRINYNASSHNLMREYIDENNVADNSYTLWTDFWNVGTPNQFNQQLVVNYDIPIDKIPVFSFIKSTYSYTSDYSWQRASLALSSIEGSDGTTYDLGNTIQNASSHRLNTTFNMNTFYKYIGLGKKPATPAKPAAAPKPGEKVSTAKPAPAKSSNMYLDGLIGVLTCIKNIQVNYALNQGTSLPGYLPSIGYFGTSKPTLGFVFGAQDDVRFESAKNGWLTTYPDFNQNYNEVLTETTEMIANLDLFPDFKIDLNANRAYTETYSEQYDVDEDGNYNSRSPYSFGNYSISTILIGTSFSSSDEYGSAAFNNFRSNRIEIADRLASGYYGSNIPRYGDSNNPIPTDTTAPNYAFYTANVGYPIGFGKNNQAVLIPSFLSAYSGKSSNKISLDTFSEIPLPNWTVKYTGLMRYKYFKDTFKRFSIQHAYRAAYTINAFRSNFDYDQNPGGQDNGGYGNFYNSDIIANINLVEQFNPLIRFDFELKNSLKILAEVKKDRSMSMSFDNNLMTEVQGEEFIIGTGYRIKDVSFTSKLAGNPSGIVKSDINIKLDFSYRVNKTIVRYLDYDNNQIGGGQDIWTLRLTADYYFSRNLSAIFFYDHSYSQPVISTSFPLTNIRTGFTLRYNFGN
jgi:cell surface protein SprA